MALDKKELSKTRIKVGILTLAAVGILVLAIGAVGLRELFKNYNVYVVPYKGSISGLNSGARVEKNGIVVGKVESFEEDTNPQIVKIYLKVETSLKLTSTARAYLKNNLPTSIKYVDIDPGDGKGDPLKNSDKIQPGEGTLDQLDQTFQEVRTAVQNIRDFTENLKQLTGPEYQTRFAHLLGSIDALTVQMNESVVRSTKTLEAAAEQFTATGREASVVLRDLHTTVVTSQKDFETMVAALADDAELLRTILARAVPILDQSKRAASEIKEFAGNVRDHPYRLVRTIDAEAKPVEK